ncbi:MAG: tRNA (adenosine(37)-N6)-dimethylallyltransferase MiaA [Proteobacteria bacterium]|nr:tRNA (adenosine(37)-N6)-dimethylallyltransferase MiaA [Pseudomonadota bacterium]
MNCLIISGPTASGKSRLALDLASLHDIAIINADSLQIYQGLPILSSQPTEAEKKIAPHFLYSHFKAQENSSVMDWLKLVETKIAEVQAEKKLPVIVGGSGMYISKLIEGISEMPEISKEVKKSTHELYEKIGHEEFRKKFGENKIIDKQRLIRAGEVFLQTGKSISYWQKDGKKISFLTDFLHINLNPDREKLYENCNSRFVKMLECGALEEVKNLVADEDCSISKTLGFREIKSFLSQEMSHEQMIEIATQKTRNYAKRQITWFRNQLPEKMVFSDAKQAIEFIHLNL